jgi:thiosulfate/3-mercaptopyruvate sulfurtransferase
MSTGSPLISTDWLAAHIAEPNLRVADASWYLPQAGRNARAEYDAAHIPGAVFFDIDAISDQTTDLPHMLPDPVAFASAMRKLGIWDADFMVFYDGAGIYSSPRALWMMRAMGHGKAAVLDGGFPKWRREGRAIESSPPCTVARSHFTPHLQTELIRDFNAILANLEVSSEQLVDARSPGRFRGDEPEPRPGVRPGHIPQSINLYYADVLAPDGTMRAPGDLKKLFTQRGVDLERPVVTACGSGVTAAILFLALDLSGAKETALYDGSWSEWGARADAPVETGGR